VKAGRFGLFEDFVCSSEAVTPTSCTVNDSSPKITTTSSYWKKKRMSLLSLNYPTNRVNDRDMLGQAVPDDD
jgi:hypothetical protein